MSDILVPIVHPDHGRAGPVPASTFESFYSHRGWSIDEAPAASAKPPATEDEMVLMSHDELGIAGPVTRRALADVYKRRGWTKYEPPVVPDEPAMPEPAADAIATSAPPADTPPAGRRRPRTTNP